MTSIKIINATTINDITFANNLPYNTHLHERSSSLSIWSFLNTGDNNNGVNKSSTNDVTISLTFEAIINHTATQITLYHCKNIINSCVNVVSIIKNNKVLYTNTAYQFLNILDFINL